MHDAIEERHIRAEVLAHVNVCDRSNVYFARIGHNELRASLALARYTR